MLTRVHNRRVRGRATLAPLCSVADGDTADVACSAGATPKSTPVATAITVVNPSTFQLGDEIELERRGAAGEGGNEDPAEEAGQDDAECCANHREHQAFNQQLPDDAAAAGADGQPHRDLPLPRRARASNRLATFAHAISSTSRPPP